jgi:hypothetical protein
LLRMSNPESRPLSSWYLPCYPQQTHTTQQRGRHAGPLVVRLKSGLLPVHTTIRRVSSIGGHHVGYGRSSAVDFSAKLLGPVQHYDCRCSPASCRDEDGSCRRRPVLATRIASRAWHAHGKGLPVCWWTWPTQLPSSTTQGNRAHGGTIPVYDKTLTLSTLIPSMRGILVCRWGCHVELSVG